MHNIITELQSFGVRLESLGHGSKGGAGPTEGSAFIVNGVVFSAPIAGHYVKKSPYFLQKDGKNYLLLKNDRKIAPIDVVAEPKFYHYQTDDGVPFRKLALLHGKDCLATTVLQNCVHWKKGQQCAFCATEISLSNNSTVKYKTPTQLSQVVRVAYENDNITHIVLTTGTGDPPGSEIAYLAQCTKAIKAKVDIPIQVQCAPPPDFCLIDQLHDAGADAVGIHVESFDQAILKAVAPAKAEIGLAHYEKAWQRAVDLFGPNQVSSFLISGLGESRESILWGSEFLADLGVFPFVVPLRPIPGSKLQDQTPPDPEYMKGIYNAVARIIQKK
ncbi:MAG: MSMEG_0568 family radical SAM protein, partial [Thermodesulfobacteriota bacterium]